MCITGSKRSLIFRSSPPADLIGTRHKDGGPDSCLLNPSSVGHLLEIRLAVACSQPLEPSCGVWAQRFAPTIHLIGTQALRISVGHVTNDRA